MKQITFQSVTINYYGYIIKGQSGNGGNSRLIHAKSEMSHNGNSMQSAWSTSDTVDLCYEYIHVMSISNSNWYCLFVSYERYTSRMLYKWFHINFWISDVRLGHSCLPCLFQYKDAAPDPNNYDLLLLPPWSVLGDLSCCRLLLPCRNYCCYLSPSLQQTRRGAHRPQAGASKLTLAHTLQRKWIWVCCGVKIL